jgi:hypothetical protein
VPNADLVGFNALSNRFTAVPSVEHRDQVRNASGVRPSASSHCSTASLPLAPDLRHREPAADLPGEAIRNFGVSWNSLDCTCLGIDP